MISERGSMFLSDAPSYTVRSRVSGESYFDTRPNTFPRPLYIRPRYDMRVVRQIDQSYVPRPLVREVNG